MGRFKVGQVRKRADSKVGRSESGQIRNRPDSKEGRLVRGHVGKFKRGWI